MSPRQWQCADRVGIPLYRITAKRLHEGHRYTLWYAYCGELWIQMGAFPRLKDAKAEACRTLEPVAGPRAGSDADAS